MSNVIVISGGVGPAGATRYTGTGSSREIILRQPISAGSMVLLKREDQAQANYLFDTVRGINNSIQTESTNSQGTVPSSLTAFNGSGITVGTSVVSNGSGNTYVALSWIERSSYLDIISYTGNGSNRTISHNLGTAPQLIIIKNLSSTADWVVGDGSAASFGSLSTTGAWASDTAFWNNTAATSSVFSLGTSTATNNSGDSYIAYVFGGLTGASSIGTYVGTGTTNTVSVGFKPKIFITKSKTASGGWELVYVDGSTLYQFNLNSTAAPTIGSNSVTSTSFTTNNSANGVTYLYAAWR